MKRGPKPSGKAMTAAQRQARYRAAHADGTPRLRYCRPADRRSMAQRWRDAVGAICRAPIDHGPTACRRTLLIAPRRKRCGQSVRSCGCAQFRVYATFRRLDRCNRAGREAVKSTKNWLIPDTVWGADHYRLARYGVALHNLPP